MWHEAVCLSLLGSHQHIVLQTMLASEARYPLEKALKNNKQQRTEGCYLGPKILESVLVSLIQSGLAEKCEIFNQRVLLMRILGRVNLAKELHSNSPIVDYDDDDDYYDNYDDDDDHDNNRVRPTSILKLSITSHAYLVRNDEPILLGLHCFVASSSCTSDTIP